MVDLTDRSNSVTENDLRDITLTKNKRNIGTLLNLNKSLNLIFKQRPDQTRIELFVAVYHKLTFS